MRLTSKGRYAVMAMADLLANGGTERAVPLQEVAGRQQISLSYLEQLFAKLRVAGLVKSVRGPGGGYRIGKSADIIRVSDIVRAVGDAPRKTKTKSDGTISATSDEARSITAPLWDELGAHIASFLSGITLADVVAKRVKQPAIVNQKETVANAA
jgi:Rrf2 family transcriptional regulator, iron-sulfur cluster assembly transcription factor